MVPRPAHRTTWRALLAHREVVERAVPGGPVGLMAFHGGLERGTSEIATAAAAASGASLYAVDQPTNLRWHVPSSTVDPAHAPALAAWLSHVEVAIALHGYGRIAHPRRVLLGGTNRDLAADLGAALAVRLAEFDVVTDLALIPPELRGLHPGNPVNRPPAGGVQLELPPSARGTSPRSGDAPTRVVDALVEVARRWGHDLTAGPGPAPTNP